MDNFQQMHFVEERLLGKKRHNTCRRTTVPGTHKRHSFYDPHSDITDNNFNYTSGLTQPLDTEISFESKQYVSKDAFYNHSTPGNSRSHKHLVKICLARDWARPRPGALPYCIFTERFVRFTLVI